MQVVRVAVVWAGAAFYLPTCRTNPGTVSVSAVNTKGRTAGRSAMRFGCAWMTTTPDDSISVDVFAGTGSAGGARSLLNTVRVGYPQDRAMPVETTDDEYKPSRASDLSVLRHEIGHVTDRGFGMRGDPSEARILGRTYPAWYLMEIGAWRAAVRDAPYNRVQWPPVAKSLRSYLAELLPLPDAWQTAKAHTAPTSPSVVCNPGGRSAFTVDDHCRAVARRAAAPSLGFVQRWGSWALSDAGRRTRTLCGVAVIRHPCQLSTSSTSKRVAILSNNAVRPGCGSRTSRRP